MLRKLSILTACCLLFVLSPSLLAQKTRFSQENAYSILSVIVNDIGPRPMGSPAEQHALNFAVAKFQEYGCDQAYVMPMKVAKQVNTNSGIAVGVKKGKSGRIIVIGGHIDSSGPDVPGANDDGSGTACVIELARVIAQNKNDHTVVFCCWGGEEEGLRGSTHFVENFAETDSVDLMLQLDMADGGGPLLVDPNGEKASAPQWLVEAAFDIAHRELGYDDVVYYTREASLNRAAGGVTGSDHIPFIDKGIPAIDFTSDVTLPIHVPQDNWENFTPSGLQRTGDIALKLFERFDAAVPAPSIDHYLLLQFGSTLFFFPYWLLWSVIVFALASGVIVFVVLLRNRQPVDPEKLARWSGFKLLLFWLSVQSFIWFSETIIGYIKGYRFPWVNNFTGYEVLGILFGALGIWCVLQIARRYRLTYAAFPYAAVSLIVLSLFTILSSLASPEFGIHFATALFLASVSFLVTKPVLRFLLLLVSGLVIYRLVFFESLGLIQRVLTLNQVSTLWGSIFTDLIFVIITSIVFLPFPYALVSIYRSSNNNIPGVGWFRGKGGLVAICFAIAGLTIGLLSTSVYDKTWASGIRVQQDYFDGADSSTFVIRSTEYLTGTNLKRPEGDSLLSGRFNYLDIQPVAKMAVPWTTFARMTSPERGNDTDTTRTLSRRIEIHSLLRPLRVDVKYRSEQAYEITSPWSFTSKGSVEKQFTWYAFPETLIVVPVSFVLKNGQQIIEEIEVRYDTLAYPLSVERQLTNISYRTIVTARDTFAAKSSDRLATKQ